MNSSLGKGLHEEGMIIPSDYYSKSRSDYPLLNAISSELHTPVTFIKSQVQLLKKFCNYPDLSLVNETFSFCEDSIESIREFIEKIKFLCSSDFSHVKPTLEWYSLQLLINQVFSELRQQNLDIKRIKFNNPNDDFNIFPDKYLFLRILVNLLSNAMKFSSQEVELLISISGNEFSIVVRDSGIGIPGNQIPEIFNPFVRGTNVNKVKGSGLGLSVVTNIVKWLNGNITLHSEVGKGTEFKIIFPIHDDVSGLICPSQKKKLPEHLGFRDSEYSRIIGTVSHELRTPIAILKSNIQLLKILTFDIDVKLKEESISSCEGSLNEMERFIDRLPLINIAFKSEGNADLNDSGKSRLRMN